MNSYIIYLLKVCFGICMFAIPYFFILRNDPNLNLKRFFLLSGVLLSFLIPALALKRPEIITVYSPSFVIDPVIVGQSATPEIAVNPPINWPTVILAIYLCGALVLLFRNVFLLIKWNAVWNRADNRSRGVAFSGNDEVFAIFSRIFLPAKLENTKELDAILLHEKAHISQLHYIDLIIIELTLLITWFNPFTWLISAMVKENHEHLADRAVLTGGIDPANYRIQLLNQSLGVQVFSLAQQFNHSLTKKRFEMMKKSKSIRPGLVKIIILIPLILLTLGFAVGKNKQGNTISGKVVFSDTGKPASGTSIIVSQTTTGTVSDNEGNYKLELKEKAQIVFSYVGYQTTSYWFNPGEYRLVSLERAVIAIGTDGPPVKVIGYGTSLNEKKPDDIVNIKSYDKFGNSGGKDLIVVTTEKKDQKVSNTIISEDNEIRDSIQIRRIKNYKVKGDEPLIIIDGVQKTLEDFTKLNPNEIEIIEVRRQDRSDTVSIEKDKNNIYTIKNNIYTISSGKKGGVIKVTTKDKGIKSPDSINPPASVEKPKSDAANQAKEEKLFLAVEEMPQFPGGEKAFMEYVYAHIEYPAEAIKNNLSGRVVVQFIVSSEGIVKDVKIKTSTSEVFKASALKAIQSSPAWKPGKQQSKPVSVLFEVPIDFKLSGVQKVKSSSANSS